MANEAWTKVLAQESATLSPYSRLARLYVIAAEECAKVAEDEDHQVDGRGYYDQLGDSKGTQKNIVAAIRAKFALSGLKDAAK